MKFVKKWFSAGILVFTFFVVGATISPSVSSAEDVWFYSNDESWSYYLDTDHLRRYDTFPQYTVVVKKVINGKFQGDFEILGFSSENDTLMCYTYNRMNGRWEYPRRVSTDPYTSAAWRAMQPYL